MPPSPPRADFGGDVIDAHVSLYDPFAMLLHATLDRLFAMWQSREGAAWRLDARQVYGEDLEQTANRLVDPWRSESTGSNQRGATGQRRYRTHVDPSVVELPCSDTMPVPA